MKNYIIQQIVAFKLQESVIQIAECIDGHLQDLNMVMVMNKEQLLIIDGLANYGDMYDVVWASKKIAAIGIHRSNPLKVAIFSPKSPIPVDILDLHSPTSFNEISEHMVRLRDDTKKPPC